MILLWLGIEPHTGRDHEKLAVALQQLIGDDPSLAVKIRADGTMLLGAPDEDRLEVLVDQLARRFDVKAALRRLEIA